MSRNTGLLTERCDPYGAESQIRLMGGLFPVAMAGKVMWHCPESAIGRYRMICQGGEYGFTRSPGQGIIAAYTCPGGHTGQVMPLCKIHVREFNVGPPRPGYTADKKTPYGQIGGTDVRKGCPACAAPPEARPLMDRADYLNQQIAEAQAYGILNMIAKLTAEQDQVRAELDILNERGITHICPLKLTEVS